MKNLLKLACASAAALLALQGCGTSVVSKNVDENGHAGQVVFPKIADSAWLKEGTFPNLDNLGLIAPGISKDQLYELVGRPHFAEGIAGVREWDYIFNFRTGKGSEFVTCQYKVIFDKNFVGRSFLWAPAACADRLTVTAPPERIVERVVERAVDRPVPMAAPAPLVDPLRIRVSGDLLFAFDRSGPGDLLPGGVAELDRVLGELKAAGQIERIEVYGFTDRLGSEAYNQKLSEARAETVRQHFVARGIPADRMVASGQGMNAPVVECTQTSHRALVACLAPNRRVEIVATGKAKP
jgi:outer membrane protein OmpA-like peptidoglycan-associated protein